MNKYTSALSTVLAAGTLFFTNCSNVDVNKMAEEQGLTINPSPLELHGDSVVFDIDTKLPAKTLKKGFTYDVVVQYNPNDAEPIEVGVVSFNGDDYADAPEATPSLSERMAFAYEDKFERGQLEYLGRATKVKNQKVKETNDGAFAAMPNGLGQGVITTSKNYQPVFIANYADHGYNDAEEYIPTNVDFFFLQGSSVLRYSEKRGEQGKALTEYVSASNPTRTVTITGSHSPEGSTEANTKLANKRPEAVQSYYESLLKKYKVEEGEAPQFVTKPVVENWSAFKAILKDSDKFTDAEKDEILSVVNGSGDFVSKQLKLQSLASYKKLFRYVYPPLRNAKSEILEIKDKLDPEVIKSRAASIADGQMALDSLSTPELLYAAHFATDLDAKVKIYEAAIRKDDSAIAHNNLGATYFAQAKAADADAAAALIEKAIPHFETAAKSNSMPEAYANLAGAKLTKGDVEGAQADIAKANSSNPSVAATTNAVKGYVALSEGDYDGAIQYFSSAGDDATVLYNKGLAYLLKAEKSGATDFSQATAAFGESINAQDNAWAHYGNAIVAARQSKADEAIKEIKAAGDLKTKAAQDLEFFALWENADFQAATK
ncbi:tetratricopeptide repeat protein [Flammeovirga yaeyamensis]|uniref:Tetratricopeptide repeat protein n=1 Tax=Flammeovirga yaeyamensis TaxID=367791 RepID=A0AAX1N1P1_9BACT|nr:tetratricopeptide repeat protein [Flammeovirga yaeyamensis]MBB3698141.1 tetratricopeptide (TPR) repeat protein/outer membrane protein OmpA-like peptidoglycan-associated protein [Flammeovirga yaeyamensis]NMF34502.1 tetratricopeptide repeat protein [Flammeovirga yaeyamensis]QWG01480.1 tetratricopeptide repeat protein [Flammeovirga yaeyamensis]